MAQNVNGAQFAYAIYGFEATYGTVAASFPRPFGQGVTLSVSEKNNFEFVYGVGARNSSVAVARKYEGNLSIEFLLGAGDTLISGGGASWLRAVLGAVPTDGGAGPYTHSYAESDTLVGFSVAAGLELGTNDYVANFIGCKVNSATITTAVGEVAKVRLDCPFRTVTVANSSLATNIPSTETPLTFAQGALSVGGTTVGFVQSVELTIDNELEMGWGLGSRYSTFGTAKKRKYGFKMNVKFSDYTLLLTNFYGASAGFSASALATLNPAGVACILTFDNGLSSTSSRKIVFTFANLFLDTHDLKFDINEVVAEDITAQALSCTTIIVTNNQATDVATP